MSVLYISSSKGKRNVMDNENYIDERDVKKIVGKQEMIVPVKVFYKVLHARIHYKYDGTELAILQTICSDTHSSSHEEIEA